MIVGTTTEGPVEFALRLFDRQIVDAGVAVMHHAVLVEFPVFISVGAKPVAGVVVRLVGEADGDASSVEGPQFLDEAVIQFATPLSGQEIDDLFAAIDELCAISPLAIHGITERDFFGVAGVPIVLCLTYFGGCGFTSEGRY